MTAWSPLMERALRVAADAHKEQLRKTSRVPYITHPVAVTMLLLQYGFDDEETLAAALLHDVVEDTTLRFEDLAGQFPDSVLELVADLTERKLDEHGRDRPWEDRKQDHLAHMATARPAARAIALADKLHNLSTMAYDIEAGEDLSERFNARFERLVWYYASMIEAAAGNDCRLQQLADAARAALHQVQRLIGE